MLGSKVVIIEEPHFEDSVVNTDTHVWNGHTRYHLQKKTIKGFSSLWQKKKISLKFKSLRTSHLGLSVLRFIKIQDSVYYLPFTLCINYLFSSSMYGEVTSRLVHSTPKQAVQVWALAGDIVLCSWARHLTLMVPPSTQVYKWVPANLIMGVTLQWTSIPSRGE